MVHYVFTPWRDRNELLLVRRQLYASFDSPIGSEPSTTAIDEKYAGRMLPEAEKAKITQQEQHQAVARVSMWMQRGNCPHMVESTALLMAAILSDQDAAGTKNAASSAYAIRAAYSAAFSRFVTGLLDGHQDKLRKQSMYSIAKNIGLPATFVELRHQSTHEQLPSLAKLRSAAKKALLWIWDYYWKHLGNVSSGPCRDAVLKYLREDDETRSRRIVKDMGQWPAESVLETIADVKKSLPGNKAFVKCEELIRLVEAERSSAQKMNTPVTDTVMDGADTQSEEDTEHVQDNQGWTRFEGTWTPKPIGIV